MKKESSKLLNFLFLFKKRWFGYATSSIGVSCRNFLLTWLTAFISSRVIAVVETGVTTDLCDALWQFAIVLLAYAVIDTLAMYFSAMSKQKIENDIRAAAIRGILYTSWEQSQKMGGSGEFLSRVDRDTASAVGLLSGGIIMVAMCAISGIGASIIIVRESILICAGLYLIGILGFFAQNRLTAYMKKLSKKQREVSSKAMSIYLQMLSRSADIKLSGKTDYALTLYQTEITNYRKLSKKIAIFSGLSDGISESVNLFGVFGTLGICVYLYSVNRISLESTVMLSQMATPVVLMTLSLYQFLSNLRNSLVGIERVTELTDLPTEDLTGTDVSTSDDSQWLIQATGTNCVFENGVSLSYDCQIPKNQLVALVGESGRGKTTLLRLILKLYPYTGTLRLCASDVNLCAANQIRSSIAYVPQDVPPFGGTIREILLFGNSQRCSDSELWNALETVGADHWIKTLASGLDTTITDGGTNLSGGQRQMLAIARALLLERKILVLDEAFSGIDNDHIHLILTNLKKRCDKHSVIVVTHEERIRGLCDSCISI